LGRRGEEYKRYCWGKLRGKKTLGIPRRNWKDNIKEGFQEV
jgi:hypothetical protein